MLGRAHPNKSKHADSAVALSSAAQNDPYRTFRTFPVGNYRDRAAAFPCLAREPFHA